MPNGALTSPFAEASAFIVSPGFMITTSRCRAGAIRSGGESILYAEALTAQGQDAEVHFFAKGGHGFGPGRPEDGTDQWLGLLAD